MMASSAKSPKGETYQTGSYLDEESSGARFSTSMRASSPPLSKARTTKASPRIKATKQKKIAETLPIPSYYRSIEQMYRNLDSQRSKSNKFDFGPYASPSTLKRPHNHVDTDISSTQRVVVIDNEELSGVTQQSIDSNGGFIIANGVIGENSRTVTYQMREIPTVCFAVNFTVTKYEQHWTVFIPMTDILVELMRIIRLRTRPDDVKALCTWLLSCITLDFVGDTIIAAHFDHAKLHTTVVLALTRKFQACATKVQAAVRSFLSNKRLARAAEISKRLRQSQLIAQRRASLRLGKAADQLQQQHKKGGKQYHKQQSSVVLQGSSLNSLSHVSSLSGHSQQTPTAPTDPHNKARKASTNTNTAANAGGGVNFSPFAGGAGLQATVAEVLKQRESIVSSTSNALAAGQLQQHPSYEGNTGNSSRRQSLMHGFSGGGYHGGNNANNNNGVGGESSAIGGYNRTDQALRHLRRDLTGHLSVFEEELLQLRHELDEQKLTLFYSRQNNHKEVRYTPLEEQEAEENNNHSNVHGVHAGQSRGRRSNAIHPNHRSIREEDDSHSHSHSHSHDDTANHTHGGDDSLDDSHSTNYHPHVARKTEEGTGSSLGRLKRQSVNNDSINSYAEISSMKDKIAQLESQLDQQRQESALSTQAALSQLEELRQQAESKTDSAVQLAAKQAAIEAEATLTQALAEREAQLLQLEARLQAMSEEQVKQAQETSERQLLAEQQRVEREQKMSEERALALKMELQQMIDEKITPLALQQQQKRRGKGKQDDGEDDDDETRHDGQASVNTRLDSVNAFGAGGNAANAGANDNGNDNGSLSPSQQQQQQQQRPRPQPPSMPRGSSHKGTGGNKQRVIAQAPPLIAEPSFNVAQAVADENKVKATGMWGWVMSNLGVNANKPSPLTASNLSAMEQVQQPVVTEPVPSDGGKRPHQRRNNNRQQASNNNNDEDNNDGNGSVSQSQPTSPRNLNNNEGSYKSQQSGQPPQYGSSRSSSPSLDAAGGGENRTAGRTGVMNLLSFGTGDLNAHAANSAALRKQQQQQLAQQLAEQQRLESMKLRSEKQKQTRTTNAATKLQSVFRAFKARQAYLNADESVVHAPETLLMIVPATHDPMMLKRAWNGAIAHNRADLAAIASERAQELLVSQQVRNVGEFDWRVVAHVIKVFAFKHDPDRPGPESQRQRSLAVLEGLSLLEMAIKLQPKMWESLTPDELPLALLLPPQSSASSSVSESTSTKLNQQQIEQNTPGLAIFRELRAAITAVAVERLVDHDMVAAAFKALYLLLCCRLNTNTRLLLASEDMCLALRRAIELHHRRDDTLETLLKAVVNLCIDCRRAQDFLGFAAVPECVLMSLLNRHERNKGGNNHADGRDSSNGALNPALFQLHCRAIANLCAADHERNQSAFCRGLYPNIFVKLLLLNAGDKVAGSLEQLLRAVVAVGLNHADNKRRLQAAGLCEVLLDLLRLHSPALTDESGNPRVASALLWALSHLTVASRAYRLVHQRVVATLAALQGQQELRQRELGPSGSMSSSAVPSYGNHDMHGALQQELHTALQRLMRLNGDNQGGGPSSPTNHGLKPDTPLIARAHFQQAPEHFQENIMYGK